ncbi:tetratricopeptide repeat protein [Oscillatoria sp. FACHB-1406]|uniref:tetratricopeptide repeat protein n=1 Tax=Oscillatoria sp. FACHB-1406 TaxID=2692846 RepID=UPI0016823A1A|nr:tetratricopeptide repeat protein [Oscillatoria sp. FACHB-1406]MBD2578996.1 tetratricopeptide repeat protein [Oscillatoria sp. FACHB-1406]
MIADKKIWDCLSFTDTDNRQLSKVATAVEIALLEGEDLDATIHKAHTLWKQGERDKAIALFNQAAAIDANYVQKWLDGAKERYLNLLQHAASIRTYNRTLDTAPARVKTWSRLQTGMLSSLEQWEQALTSYDQLLEVQPNNHLAWYYRGDALLELQRDDEAVAAFKRAVENEPRAKGGWLMRVRKLIRSQHFKEAIALCGYVCVSLKAKASPSDALSSSVRQEFHDSWKQLGAYFDRLEGSSEAEKAYQRAIAFKADEIETWLLRAEACETLQRYAEAIDCYDRILALDSENVAAQTARQKLQSPLL